MPRCGSRRGPGRGRLVGINTAILAHGRVPRSYLGLAGRGRTLTRRAVHRLELASSQAVEAVEVVPGGPAAAAGMRRGVILLALDGAAVDSMDRLFQLLNRIPPRSSVKLALLRHGRMLELSLTTSETPT